MVTRTVLSTLSGLVLAASGCAGVAPEYKLGSLVQAGVRGSDVVTPDISNLGIELTPTTRSADALEQLLKEEEKPRIIVFGEPLPTPWVPITATAQSFVENELPMLVKKFGVTDVVVEYLPTGFTREQLDRSREPKVTNDVTVVMKDFKATALLAGAKAFGLTIHAGGYTPGPGKRLDRREWDTTGVVDGRGTNPHYLTCVQETGRRSAELSLELARKGKIVLVYGPTLLAEPDIASNHGQTHVERDEELYPEVHNAGLFANYRRISEEEKEEGKQGVLPKAVALWRVHPDFIDDASLLGRPVTYKLWLAADGDNIYVGSREVDGFRQYFVLERKVKKEQRAASNLDDRVPEKSRDELEYQLRGGKPLR